MSNLTSYSIGTRVTPVRAGHITPYLEFNRDSALAPEFHRLSALEGRLTASSWKLNKESPCRFGTQLVKQGEVWFLLMHLQVGDNQIVWIGDPWDRRIWKLLKEWRSSKTALFVVHTSATDAQLLEHSFVPKGPVLGMGLPKVPDSSPDRFVLAIGELMDAGAVHLRANSMVDGSAKLTDVEVLVLYSPKVALGLAALNAPPPMPFNQSLWDMAVR